MSRVPTKVVLYSYATGLAQRAAEFRWSAADGVTLEIVDPEWGAVAEQALTEGVLLHDEGRRVLPTEGAAFMCALVQPSQSTYVGYIDESEPGPAQPPAGGGGFTPIQACRFLAGLPVDPPAATSPGPPPARTEDEAQLYMDLHPCPRCGSADTPWQSGLVFVAGAPVRAYVGDCDKCGTPRRFEFRLPDPATAEPSTRPLDFGGPQPSELLDPGEWLWVADLTASKVPANDPPAARYALSVAVAAMEEILKFVPEGAARVPADAFRSARGRAVYDAEPGRFERDRLVVVRDTYRDALARLPRQRAG